MAATMHPSDPAWKWLKRWEVVAGGIITTILALGYAWDAPASVRSYIADVSIQAGDNRYASRDELIEAVDEFKATVTTAVTAQNCNTAAARIEEFEDIIEYKRLTSKDAGLEKKLLTRALRNYKPCETNGD